MASWVLDRQKTSRSRTTWTSHMAIRRLPLWLQVLHTPWWLTPRARSTREGPFLLLFSLFFCSLLSSFLTHSLTLSLTIPSPLLDSRPSFSSFVILSFGNNDHGQLGHTKRRLRPEAIDALDIYRVKQVACGSVHSLALTEDGQVLAWGLNDRGQLGIGLDAVGQVFRPKFIKAFANERIVQVACGTKHCLALGEDGKVWAWGENSVGQLGNGTFVFSHTPFAISALNGRPIRKIACGANYSMVLSVSGRVYSWGDNSFGQLGTGDTTKLLRPQILKGKHPPLLFFCPPFCFFPFVPFDSS